ncbi:DUF3375 domain-containing protein [Bifidobacterium miconisargentati]|uniref:DUF3375 domain-containing protein n=1 Tax=Bifidobacterium miconisargentati TaxID=2834437 RepID=UPI001BDC4DE7|nr:DUF3375 domain-containing protein [Bifidobacterium miconisargentati]MBW3090181.1 DUF3375 domain-containing protein [Bifidobacterium miconisargentati]
MGDVRREMERLRPVYETGVLRLLLRANAKLYVALLRAAFDPLTGELPRETLEERFAQSLSALADTGDYTPKPDQSYAEAAHQILVDLSREGDGDYAWLANAHDAASHRFLYRLTARAHRAIDALGRLEDDTRTLSGAQANSIIMEIEHARMQLTADPSERVRLLNQEIKERRHEIKRIQQGQQHAALSDDQVRDVIAVIHNTLRGVPIDLRELVLAERDNGDALRRRMQGGDMSVDEILTAYHEEYRRSFRESDSGRRFEDAFQVIITDEGRQQIDDALRDIAKTPYLAGESSALLDQIRDELARIYEGIEAVRGQMRVSDEAVSRLVRQQTDTRYRTMLGTLNRLFVRLNADAKAHPNDASRPYPTNSAGAQFAALPTRPARSMTRTAAPGLSDMQLAQGDDTSLVDLKSMIIGGGPRLHRMIALIQHDPAIRTDGRIDVAASFNRLPDEERRESELVGFLGAIPCSDDATGTTWHCTTLDGTQRDWITRPVLTTRDELDEIVRQG